MEDGDTEKYQHSRVIQDFVFLSRKRDCIRCISLQVYIEDIYFLGGEYQIYFIECGEKISIFHECAARVKMLIFSPNEMKYIWYSPSKNRFSFYFMLNGKYRKHSLTFFLVVSRSI